MSDEQASKSLQQAQVFTASLVSHLLFVQVNCLTTIANKLYY